ncbi:MAG: PIN domain-containing protein [Bacteroidota bacterium]
MIIADTSVWIEFLRGNAELSDMFIPYLRKGHIYTNSAIFGELFQGVRNKREQALLEEFWINTPKADEELCFIEAGQLSNKFKLYAKGVGLIDCYILESARKNDFAIWTLDKKFRRAIDEIRA